MASSIYDFTVKDQQGNDVSLADYRGRVLLVVNTATECGFTPTYAQLQKLYTALHERGLDILDFPCDQFGHQAPGTNEEIAQFCTSRFHRVHPRRRGTRRGGAAVAFSARTYLAQAHEARTREPGRRIHRDAAFFCASECFT